MKILFVFKSENFLAPVGLCAISAIALREGHKTYLCEMNSRDPLEHMASLRPDIVAYSSSTGESKHYLKINRLVKDKFPETFTIMGGPHPTFYPEVISEDNNLDAICVGEGEEAFAELLGTLSRGNPFDSIPNIVTRNNKGKLPVRNLVDDLDSLPFPDFALLYDNTLMGKYPLKNFIASRGCPYRCTYCFNPAWNKLYEGRGRKVRRHSVDYIIDEIGHVRDSWPLSCVKFYDDCFTYGIDGWLEEFAYKYKKQVGLPFFILTRVDLLTEDMVKLLKYAGCRTISMSIEAGNPEIRKNMLKREMSNEQIVHAHRLCDKYGIYTFTNCVIGLPGTKIDDDIESINLAIKARVTWAEFLIFHPYPGTELGQKTVDMGYYNSDYGHMHTSYMHSSPLNCFSLIEKNAQMNISVLGAVAVVFPVLRSLIVNCLIHVPHNIFFTMSYYLTKMYIIRKKIYVTKTDFCNSVIIFIRSLKQEWFRHENKKG